MAEETPEMLKNPLSQAELLALLQTTLEELNGIVKTLKTQSPDQLPTQATVETLVKTTQAIAKELEPPSTPSPVPTPVPVVEPKTDTISLESQLSESVEEIDSTGIDSRSSKSEGNPILEGIRSLVPLAIFNKLSKGAIIGIIATGLVLVISTAIFLVPKPLIPVAEQPQEPPKPKIVSTPPELESPALPQPVAVLPPPEPEFTPEQNLIAAIQQEVSDLTRQYPEGLIGSIEANFSASRLIVTLGTQWYQLSAKNQDSLAQSILKRAQKLDFRKLEMRDSQSNLIARSPVVGDQIIIIHREKLIAS
ncbi:conserved hypothetical protein [Rippkaea orientalis PCC 8801]|uniref:Uncharacterized protein n=1 Tax=Rippkaea orientalis (strain PCC 8801 / RF-1) TaxID=41431 RepID=B7K0Y5_RIPO1|nr:hypothetical protein [Rippkaea orientalis]ACK65126.1 conserved hypothetical protein [Rippkaea orientalis PCC 8801]